MTGSINNIAQQIPLATTYKPGQSSSLQEQGVNKVAGQARQETTSTAPQGAPAPTAASQKTEANQRDVLQSQRAELADPTREKGDTPRGSVIDIEV